MEKPPREELYQFIGPPLLEEFQKVYGVDRAVSEEMLRHFRVYFEEKGLYENQLSEGVLDMLSRLKESACQLVLATSKPEPFADMILHHLSLIHIFRNAKKVLKRAFEKHQNHEGFCLVEILTPCPTNWGLAPADAMKRIRETVIPEYPLGVFVDRGGKA